MRKLDNEKINEILKNKEKTFDDSGIQRGIKNGIELEKGVVLTKDFFVRNFE